MTESPGQPQKGRIRLRLIVVLTAVVTITVAAFSVLTLAAFDRAIAPEVQDRTRLIGTLIRLEVQRTLELGIPMAALGGLDDYISETIADFPEIRRIAIATSNGTTIAEIARETAEPGLLGERFGERIGIQGRSFSLPVLVGSDVVGEIVIEGSAQFAETRLRDVMLDVGVLAIAILLIGVELALVAASASIWKPRARLMRLLAEQRTGVFQHTAREAGVPGLRRIIGRLNDHVADLHARGGSPGDQPARLRLSDLNDIRLPLFLYVLATEITASFLPIYAAGAARPDSIPYALAAAAPLFLYLLASTVVSAPAAGLAARFGPRRLFLYSIPLSVVGLVIMATSENLAGITFGRGLIALSYALVVAACQAYTRGTGTADGGSPSSAIVGTIFGGAFCGSVIGGVIAGRFGYPAAIASGILFALCSAAAAHYAMRGTAGDSGDRPDDRPLQADIPKNRLQIGALIVAVAVPASAVTAIFIWYQTPLLLSAAGLRPADIARVVMLYYLAAILVGPVTTEISERSRSDLLPLAAGIVITSLALFSLRFWSGDHAIALAVLGVGIGHALIRAPLLDLAVAYANGSLKVVGLVRTCERLGAMIALVTAAFLADKTGGWTLAFILGIVTAVGGLSLAVVSAITFPRKRS